MIKCALFDLDGTLVDTSVDLARAVKYVLECYGKEDKWSIEDYISFVGNGARKLVERAFEYSLDENELDKAFALFKKKYQEILLDNATPYPLITETLTQLKSNGIKLAVVTNKPHDAAVKMVESVFGKDMFDVIIGASDDIPKKPDPYSANLALEKMGCKASEAIYFGDSDVDVKTAKNAGVEAVACSWGFRSFESLMSAAPSVIIDSAKYILKLF